ncbi:hypothetical protein GCM10018952_03320 [Streptosporangium vulgare]
MVAYREFCATFGEPVPREPVAGDPPSETGREKPALGKPALRESRERAADRQFGDGPAVLRLHGYTHGPHAVRRCGAAAPAGGTSA